MKPLTLDNLERS